MTYIKRYAIIRFLSVTNLKIQTIRFSITLMVLKLYDVFTYKLTPAFSNYDLTHLFIFIALAFKKTNLAIFPFLPLFHQY